MEELFRRIDEAYGRLTGPELEQRLRELCARAEERFGAESREAASAHSELGSYFRGQLRLEESEAEFARALALLERLGLGRSADCATVVNNLGGTHRLMRRFDDAERDFARCMELYRESVGEGHILFAAALNNLSLVKLDRGALAEARELLRRSSGILRGLPEHRDEYAASLVNLGVLSLRCGALEEAERELTEAAELFDTELSRSVTAHRHAALHALSGVYEAEGRPEDALAAEERALAAAQRIFGPEHPEVRRLTQRLARLRGEDKT